MYDFSVQDRLSPEVIDYPTAAKLAGISLMTFRRLVSLGQGPRVLRLSPRRVGVRVADLRAWLDERAVESRPRAAASEREPARKPAPTLVATEERLEAWRSELARRRRPDGTLPHGAISAIARDLAERHGTSEEAERRVAYDHRDALGL